MYERHLDARRHIELLHGYTTAAVVNCSDYRPKEPIAPSRFMPSLFDPVKAPTPQPLTRKQTATMVRGIMSGLVAATNRN